MTFLLKRARDKQSPGSIHSEKMGRLRWGCQLTGMPKDQPAGRTRCSAARGAAQASQGAGEGGTGPGLHARSLTGCPHLPEVPRETEWVSILKAPQL